MDTRINSSKQRTAVLFCSRTPHWSDQIDYQL